MKLTALSNARRMSALSSVSIMPIIYSGPDRLYGAAGYRIKVIFMMAQVQLQKKQDRKYFPKSNAGNRSF